MKNGLNMQIRQYNEEVLYIDDNILILTYQDIQKLKEKALNNRRKRIRICAHKDINDSVHEMLIVHVKDAYIRPHKHINKPESFHVIEGAVDIILFNEDGGIIEVIRMKDYFSGGEFYYRISEPFYHTLLIGSEFLVFHETTSGPFIRSDTIFAPWSPGEDDTSGSKIFMGNLTKSVEKYWSMSITSDILSGK